MYCYYANAMLHQNKSIPAYAAEITDTKFKLSKMIVKRVLLPNGTKVISTIMTYFTTEQQ